MRATDLAPGGLNLGQLRTANGNVDVSAYEAAHNPAGGPLDSNPFHIAALPDGSTLVTDAGANALLRVASDGTVSAVASFASRALGGPFPTEPVPTGVAIGPDGATYVSELTGFPFVPGSARIYRIAPGEAPTVFATGFTMLSDIAFGADGALYALEYDSNGLLAPGTAGALWRVNGDGTRSLIEGTGLDNATGLAIHDDAFYVSVLGHSSTDGAVVMISAVPEPETWAMLVAGMGAIGWLRRRRLAAAGGSPARG